MSRRVHRRRRERIMPVEDDSSSEDRDSSHIRGPRVFDDSDDEPEGIQGDDEEIDSDEAFGEDDEYDMGGRNDDDAQEEEEDGEDMIALSNLLDEAPDEDEAPAHLDEEEDAEDDFGIDDPDWDAIWSKKRAHTDDTSMPKKRTARPERTEAVGEATEAAGSSDVKLSLQDLMAHDSGTSLANVQALAEQRSSKGSQPTASKRGGGVLHAPLPTPVQDRLDRVEAYKLSKEEVEGWAPTIKRIREADHLSFPLQPPVQPPAPSNAGLTASFAPTTDMEKSVASLLHEGGLSEKQLAEQEELVLRDMDPAEAGKRQAELRRMRELMFRAEQKARRANKIKSKTYRRIHRRERERMKQQEAQDLQDDDDDEEQRYQAAKDRAKERATLRHKNTGKWAKFHAGRNDDASQEARLAVEDQLRQGEELRKRIHVEDSDDESLVSVHSDDREAAFNELESFARKEAEQDERDAQALEQSGKKSKSLMHMKFMQDARDKQSRETQETIASLREELEHEDDTVNERPVGRAVYSQGTKGHDATLPANPFHTGASNPWLRQSASGGTSKQTPQVLVGKDSRAATRSIHRTERHVARGDEARASAAEDATLAIDPTAQLEALSSESEAEPTEITRHARGKRGRGKRNNAPLQRDLVAEAFAGDNVALDFAKEKRAMIQADAPQEQDMTLPGWGSWGGKGVRHRQKKHPALIKKIDGLDPSRRKDFGMEHVMINERQDKKASKYKAKDLPFPYTSAAQYEAAMRTPLGSEWNTRTQHQRLTMPRVTTKMGQRIDPIQRKF